MHGAADASALRTRQPVRRARHASGAADERELAGVPVTGGCVRHEAEERERLAASVESTVSESKQTSTKRRHRKGVKRENRHQVNDVIGGSVEATEHPVCVAVRTETAT